MPAPRWPTPAAQPGAPPRGSQRAAASDPARALGTSLKRRWQQEFAAPPPPFSPGAGGKPAAGPQGGPHPAGAPHGYAAGQQQWRQLARQAALRGKRVAVLPAAAYGGYKDASAAGAAVVAGGGRRTSRSGRWP